MSAIRHQISIDASSRSVWAALTTEAGVKAWWADQARLDAREGGRIVVTTQIGEEAVEQAGIFHIVKPTRQLEIAWDAAGKAPTRGARTQLQVGRRDGETKVHVVISGGAGMDDPEAHAAVDAFWKEAMLRLRRHLEATDG